MSSEILIIGAGAAGLVAARHLAAAGYTVRLLEAAPVPGGRMHTVSVPGFAGPVEAGAEFVHGDLPITLELAREAGVPLLPTHYEQMTADRQPPGGPDHWNELMQEMGRLSHDLPVEEFLSTHFATEKYAGLRASVRGYAEGYDLADIRTASTKALYAEWTSEEDSSGYRLEGGYGRLTDFLVRECDRLGVRLHFSSAVTEIHWSEGRVGLRTAEGEGYSGGVALVTVSLGVLSRIVFEPAIPDRLEAASQIGYGSVIKILLEFRTAFWRRKHPGDKTLFILSRQPVPTWWTQTGAASTQLTGWLTGQNMRNFLCMDEKDRLGTCLASLAEIFSVDAGTLREELKAWHIVDWGRQPFVRGGYSFDTVMTPPCRRLLRTPLADTLFFAGEAIYEGHAPGTVEAAFHSGREAAEKIIARHKPRY